MANLVKDRELSDRQRRRLQVGESVYFSTSAQYQTKSSPHGRWVVKVRRTERGRQISFPVRSFEKPDEAVKYAESTRPENRKSDATGQVLVKSAKGGVITVSDLYAFCKAHTFKRLSGKRIVEKDSRWRNHIESYWGSWPICTVRRRNAQEWVTEMEAKLEEGKGLSQLAECRFDLNGYFNAAIKMDFYEWANPFSNLDFTPPTPRSRTTVESQDFSNILRTMDLLVGHGLALQWIADMFQIALLSGMRQGEILALMGKKIDLDRKAVLVDRALARNARNVDEYGVPYGKPEAQALSFPKGGNQADPKARWVAIPDQLIPVLQRLKECNEGLVFGTDDDKLKQGVRFHNAWSTLRSRLIDIVKGEETRRKATQTVIEVLKAENIKLPDVWTRIDFRDTRNSFASYAAEVGIPEPTRMALMGHTGSSVTFKSYTALTNRAFIDAQKRLTDGLSLGR